MSTKPTKLNQIKRNWHVIDAADQVLGRISTQAATLLIGKSKPYFVPNLDCGDYVVIINASKVRVTGNKLQDKIYYRNSGYPGGLKSINLSDKLDKDATKVLELSVKGMLPKNKLRDARLKRLKVFVSDTHPYQQHLQAPNN